MARRRRYRSWSDTHYVKPHYRNGKYVKGHRRRNSGSKKDYGFSYSIPSRRLSEPREVEIPFPTPIPSSLTLRARRNERNRIEGEAELSAGISPFKASVKYKREFD